MDLPTGEKYDEFVMARHPDKGSLFGAILAEILYGDENRGRAHAAIHYGINRYRRGLGALERLVGELVPVVESSDDPWSAGDERSLLGSLLIALGMSDCQRSHSVLKRLLGSSSPILRADVLEGMAFERTQIEWDLVFPYVSERVTLAELYSALYCLQVQMYASTHPKKTRRLVAPFLSHSDRMVRIFAIEVLAFDRSNRRLLLPLAEDPDDQVRQCVGMAVQFWEDYAD